LYSAYFRFLFDVFSIKNNKTETKNMSHSIDDKIDSPEPGSDVRSLRNEPAEPKRQPLDYSSFGGFARSFGERFRSLWTKRFVFSLLAGQVVSLCITCTNVTTTELVNRNWTLSTTQSVFL
jgi:solute carrier family 35, member F1/2